MNPATANIEEAILSAILAGRIAPGTRLGEQKLADLFGVSRTRVREAMMRLETRGVVQVSARRGWYVVEPSAEEAREAFHTRRVIEVGLLQTVPHVPPNVLAALKEHVAMERAAIESGDIGSRACLLGDFHIHLADALGNRLLTEIIRDLTARTTLISMLYQPTEKAEESSHDHEDIVAAMEADDLTLAARLMGEHIAKVEAGLDLTAKPDPLAGLRELLSPSTFTGNTPSVPHSHTHPHSHSFGKED
ncbi:GntR family transcriptional regulator [Ancylobacter radicis]|uniref:GntR family transcriptional regulator n=1 Tax=Ancylobacter radicis TaxID=2836179 RepID=A0ABS5RC62_9HYPH|nr:GntR family transcriptional regulator [Ancylobacter radicis]MBS9479092.1 GntR family transcriptional regulator [Ancylobacter radicis]